jgi:outer membrane protein TolC
MKVVLVALLVIASPAFAQPKQLSMPEAVDLALRQHPSVRQAQASVEAAQGRIDLARTPLHPTVTLSASASTGSSRPVACMSDPTMTCGGFLDPTASTGLGANANWRITDFGQTRLNVRAAEANAAAAAAGVDTTTLDIRRNVELAYLEAVARARLVGVADATVKSEELHLDQAKRFVAAQAKDPIEVVQAQARAANAKSALAQAQSGVAVALANARRSAGSIRRARPPSIHSGQSRRRPSRLHSARSSIPRAKIGPRSSSSTSRSRPPRRT